ncbi:beta-ketoacyl synthase N-terminal-like domain-containing protein [Streptomyces sp. AP-93]|uniref:beta-ketoacyl synthase N-terminal-like domain-containing protein n=1 Tax=Streptomyces sp. AP-93 TaxID=2929048 RepID=UPI001FAFD64D|nr:beta-ketoacyl synthase N-terminal-like domain-containing protein [Streptomyces sp. AP-93]MCJ0871744.1 hypothetical protein [Streptomyces sp. AP-93]
MTAVVITGLGTALRGVDGPAGLLPGAVTDGDRTDPVSRLTGRGLRYKDRATKLGLIAGRDALEAAGLLDGPDVLAVPGDSFGVVVSTNYGNVDTVTETVRTIAAETYIGTSPMMLPATSSNVVASWLAITHGLRGANLTLCNGPTSGLDAIGWARLLLESGRLERVLVVGVEPDNSAVRELLDAGADATPAAGTAPDPGPFDGAAALVIESAESARARGARPLAEVGPYARRADREAATAAVRGAAPGRVGLWYVPERAAAARPDGGDGPDHAAVTSDLTARLGSSSGALGVLQAAAGAAWLAAQDGRGLVLATAGTGEAPHDDAAAALILAPVAADPR